VEAPTVIGAAALLLAFLSSTAQAASPPPDPAEVIDTCMMCHEDPSLETTLPSGEVLKLAVDRQTFLHSTHGKRLSCLDCHPAMEEVPHPELKAQSLREFRIATYEACKTCHFEHYTRTLDSAHMKGLARGDRNAPTCVDCHGSHDIGPPNEPRARVSQTCGTCHAGVTGAYMSSVHGAGLAHNNPDVPVCTDCHQSHAIQGTSTEGWRSRTPDMCGGCHSDEKRMEQYGLSTNVLKTYLQDFHGVTASLDAARNANTVSATCTDCHGVHNIVTTSGERGQAMKANLVEKCRSCHPSASDDFPDAWLSHYEPSLAHAPLVFGVNLAYKILIPFMIGGLVLQILLHLWRVVVNR
jgi:predicted CXXCH cytochrome family protein